MASVDYTKAPIQEKPLYVPDLKEVANVLEKSLSTNFEYVSVEVVDSPDFTKKPFNLVAEGFGGNTKLVEVGGVPYLMPLVNREKVYDLKALLEILKRDPGFIAGAGAGPWPYPGVNCEGIINMSLKNGTVNQGTRIVKVDPVGAKKDEGKYVMEQLPNNETRTALLGNYVLSDGKPGKMLKVVCKKRTGTDNFITSIRESLKAHYKEETVGLGGTFLLKEGKSKQHVMPDFPKKALVSDEEVENWLHFFEMNAPLIHVGTMVTGDLGLDLRVQHFHCFSMHGDGGHYHYDTTPDTAEYEGYFALANSVIRVDAPVVSHAFGRD